MMTGWGNLWDRREQLAAKLGTVAVPTSVATDATKYSSVDEDNAVDTLVQSQVFQDALEAFVKMSGTLTVGATATPAQVQAGLDALLKALPDAVKKNTWQINAECGECGDQL